MTTLIDRTHGLILGDISDTDIEFLRTHLVQADEARDAVFVSPTSFDSMLEAGLKGPLRRMLERALEQGRGVDVEWTERAPSHVLHLRLISGRSLAIRDLNKKSDPYCVVLLQAPHGHTFFEEKSEIIRAELDPTWELKATVLVSREDTLIFRIMDHDMLSPDDAMGHLTFRLEELEPDTVREGWFSLRDVEQGELHVALKLKTLKPAGAASDAPAEAAASDEEAASDDASLGVGHDGDASDSGDDDGEG